ncbi:hypothetical protein FACS18949_17100 [Clostridia bacterium]|nr:hypothetical protein FACS189425_07870 [Clostridia bacterium]GHV37046.1 hypothetical protein FACS18949_17100 [Clostridia bacterium]
MTVAQKSQIVILRGHGMSYADIAERVGIPKNTVKTFCHRNTAPKETDSCLRCGKQLVKTRNTKRFCSDSCRLAWHKLNRAPAAVCVKCGSAFDNNGNTKRKYCSNNCYVSARFGGAAV